MVAVKGLGNIKIRYKLARRIVDMALAKDVDQTDIQKMFNRLDALLWVNFKRTREIQYLGFLLQVIREKLENK